ncbi:MAG: metal ABC transporter permease [Anaerolineales bacterium]
MILIQGLLEPFSHAFMVRGLAAAIMVGIVCPVLGTYVVLRGMAFFGDALAHIVLPGVVLAFLLGWPVAIGALAAGISAALVIGRLSQRGRVAEDTAIGVVFAGAFALGVAMLSVRGSYAVDLTHILFGDLLGVRGVDLWLIAGLGLGVLVTIAAFYKEFMVISFDPLLATTLRLPVTWLRNLMLVLLAVVIVVSLQAVGVALVLAMLVTPAATATLITRRLIWVMILAAVIGAGSSLAGLYLSYYLNLASGPAIVLAATAVFGVVYAVVGRRDRTSGMIVRSPASDG